MRKARTQHRDRATVLITHPGMGHGGSEARVMWLLQILGKRYEVALLTSGPFELDRLNVAYGTSVGLDDVRLVLARTSFRLGVVSGGDAVRSACVQRLARRLGPDFDVCISGYNFIDFGRPAVQFIADFSWDEEVRRRMDGTPGGVRGIFHRVRPLRAAYLRAAEVLAGGRVGVPPHPSDVVVANSRWTAALLAKRWGIEARVIYPPVGEPGRVEARQERRPLFVNLGRISPEKRIEEVIGIVENVRGQVPGLTLEVMGRVPADAYGRRIRELAHSRPWVRLRGGVYGEEKWAVLQRAAYGIHACRGEAFGIAVAEMVKAGVVPFVHREGGPAEIVGDERLVYVDPADAAA